MKSTVTREETFTPVTVTLTLENQREVDALFGLLNHEKIDQILVNSGLNLDQVYQQLKNFRTSAYERVTNALDTNNR